MYDRVRRELLDLVDLGLGQAPPVRLGLGNLLLDDGVAPDLGGQQRDGRRGHDQEHGEEDAEPPRMRRDVRVGRARREQDAGEARGQAFRRGGRRFGRRGLRHMCLVCYLGYIRLPLRRCSVTLS